VLPWCQSRCRGGRGGANDRDSDWEAQSESLVVQASPIANFLPIMVAKVSSIDEFARGRGRSDSARLSRLGSSDQLETELDESDRDSGCSKSS
jgi:hypothetical protein